MSHDKQRRGQSPARTAAFAIIVVMLALCRASWAAVGCDLNDPDRDVARLFPGSGGYKTVYISVKDKGGEKLLAAIEARLGDAFHGLYETIDIPYTVYEIYANKKMIGYIHGVNQKGQFGGIQVFLALDLDGTIKAFYVQKMTSHYAGKIRDAAFGKQFLGLALADFGNYDVKTGTASGRIAAISNPAPAAEGDFKAVLRAAKKNLVLMTEFGFTSPAAGNRNALP